jgi:hypothetical protein
VSEPKNLGCRPVEFPGNPLHPFCERGAKGGFLKLIARLRANLFFKACAKDNRKEESLMEEKKDLEKMTAVELRELALKEYPGLTGVHALKKEELVLAIHQARGEVVKEIKKKKKAGKVKADKKEIKNRLRQLQEKKNELLAGGSKKDLLRLRRRIKRLKRMTQKAAG